MAIPNVNQLTSQLRMLPDPALKQAAMMYKNDPYILPMIISEDTARKQMRMAAQSQAMGGEPPKVNQQAIAAIGQMPQPQMPPQGPGGPMPQGGPMPPQGGPRPPMPPQGAGPGGIAALQAPNMAKMADGGIAGYPDEDEVGMAEGGVTRLAPGGSRGSAKDAFIASYGPLAQQVGAELGVAPEIILSQWGLETAWGNKTVGDYNFGNIKDVSGKGPRAYDKAEGSRDAYKEYASPEAFAADYVGLIKRRFPEAVGAGADVSKFTAGLKPGQQGGFATDKGYGKKLADTLTSLVPIGSAQAAPAAPQAGVPTPAGVIPGSQPAPTYKEPSLGQKLVGTGETALSLLTGIPAMVLGGAQTAQQAISQGRAPTEQEFATNVGRFTYSPRTEAGQDISQDVAQTLGRLPPYIPGAQLGRVSRVASPATTAAEAEATAAKVSAPRLAAPTVGATRAEKEMAQVRGLQALKADQEAAAAAADKAARAAVGAERRTPAAAYAAQVPQRAGAVGAGAAAMQATTPPGAIPQETPTFRPMSDAERAKFMEANTQELASMPKEDKKDIIDAAKAVTPKANSEGWTNEDWLIAGLAALANPSRLPGFSGLLATIGGAGLAAAENKKARRKAALEEAKEESEAKYREALGEQARRGPSEIALIERVAKENNIPFTQAMEIIYSSKREPQTEEALMKAWSSSAFLQMKYPDPQQYIKLMRASSGGASQTSAADEALVSKYLNPR